jgi:hypothetical protein
MDSGSDSSDHEVQDTGRLRESVSMVIRQLQLRPQLPSRAQSDEIPESEEDGEKEEDADEEEEEEEEEEEKEDEEDEEQDEEEEENRGSDDVHDDSSENVNFNELPKRRHSISSADSNYSPSATSEDGIHTDNSSQKAHLVSLAQQIPSGYSTLPTAPTAPHKRSRSGPTPDPRPFKRRKAPLNHAYLGLLNEDILDAAAQFTPHAWDSDSPAAELGPSQIGLVYWTSAEKTLFFEALARLGRDDVAGIAARVRTKTEFDVMAYMALLQQGQRQRVQEKRQRGRGAVGAAAGVVVPADLPAAVEISQACVAALEEAADALALRQEAYEETVEKKRWGQDEGFWKIGKGNLRELEKARPPAMSSVGFFRVHSWLRLAERVFMNSSVEEYNWRCVAEEGSSPEIRATTLEDFHALAVSVTRRLVAATLYVAESRVRAKRKVVACTAMRVTPKDVEAAALSLGLKANTRDFWAKCARRLRIDVVDDEVDGRVVRRDEDGPMSYDEVERALGVEPEAGKGEDAPVEPQSSEEEEDLDHDAAPLSDAESIDLGPRLEESSDGGDLLDREETEAERKAIDFEMNELLVHSALEYPNTKRARDALRKRIRAARDHEAYADALDARASYYEERRLWAMLNRNPPVALTRVEVPTEPRKPKGTVEELIAGFSRTPGSQDWKSRLEIVPSRWEMDFALLEEKEENNKHTVTLTEIDNEN